MYQPRFFQQNAGLPWPILVILVGVAAWRFMGKARYGLLMSSFLIIIGIPTGIIMARSDTIEVSLKPILDAMQTMPSFVYLIPALMLFGLGKVPAVFATVIYAFLFSFSCAAKKTKQKKPPASRNISLRFSPVAVDIGHKPHSCIKKMAKRLKNHVGIELTAYRRYLPGINQR
ncbi:MAG: hypothetical protein KJO34_05120 [Deltaproteobacteria bacterium]|nr:hypothetical protein [Deltaproteobacteria bacterium]